MLITILLVLEKVIASLQTQIGFSIVQNVKSAMKAILVVQQVFHVQEIQDVWIRLKHALNIID